ncbi:hypothetical protein L484_010541 [Morus notabilis]|uniref:Uncharacterized protein n=1 Tax=Morus notabilis TaxID=981085 RepID=W9R5K6_9ROSA|nr:hypothetical protein L484_010541 [Morus notabilis]
MVNRANNYQSRRRGLGVKSLSCLILHFNFWILYKCCRLEPKGANLFGFNFVLPETSKILQILVHVPEEQKQQLVTVEIPSGESREFNLCPRDFVVGKEFDRVKEPETEATLRA